VSLTTSVFEIENAALDKSVMIEPSRRYVSNISFPPRNEQEHYLSNSIRLAEVADSINKMFLSHKFLS